MRDLTVSILDGDEWSLKSLSKILKNHYSKITVDAHSACTEGTTRSIIAKPPQLLIFNLELGLESLLNLTEALFPLQPYIILTCNYQQNVLKLPKLEIISYLVKPIVLEDLQDAIWITKRRLEKDIVYDQNKAKIQSENGRKFIGFTEMGNIQVVQINDILFLKSNGEQTLFFLTNGREKKAQKRIGKYEKILPPETFIRVHRQYIVNMDHVSHINTVPKLSVVLKLNEKYIPLSFRKKNELLSLINIK